MMKSAINKSAVIAEKAGNDKIRSSPFSPINFIENLYGMMRMQSVIFPTDS